MISLIMYKESELTREIIGLAMQVHSKLGPGFKEEIYHQAILNDLCNKGYEVETEYEFDVIYKNNIIGIFRVDLMVNKKVIIELKAVSGEIPKLFYTQTISYLKASGIEVGLLINFGNSSLEIKRFGNYKNYQKSV